VPRVGIPQADGSVLVPLTQGKFAIIDEADADSVLASNWSFGRQGYAVRHVGGRDSRNYLLMHRWLMDTPKGMDTDHINGNRIDNRRSNLRICTRSQNVRNRTVQRNNRSSPYKGVSRHSDGKWRLSINVAGYETAEEAARVYDRIARELHGEFARLNFPDE
jgi:hypothetical protein